MTIEWLGQHCCTLETKTASVVINPWSVQEGAKQGKMPRLAVDIVVLPETRSEADLVFLKAPAFTVTMPGEFESKGVLIEGQALNGQPSLLYRLYLDGIRIGYVGGQVKKTEAVEGFLEDLDVLLLAFNGGTGLGPSEAAELVSSLEPRLVIPLSDDKAHVDKFGHALGTKAPERLKKLSVTRKDLPVDDTRLVILEV